MRVIPEQTAVSALAASTAFTGRVWRTDYVVPPDLEGLAGSRFLYEPGARSFWHIHDHEQVIIVVHGVGLVSWEGLDSPVTVTVGDWWHVQPRIPHWHGATPDSPFAHLAVTAGGQTHWLGEVRQSDYLS